MNICECLCEPVLDACSNVSYMHSLQKPSELGSLVSIFSSGGDESEDVKHAV